MKLKLKLKLIIVVDPSPVLDMLVPVLYLAGDAGTSFAPDAV
jgi:hypothetical protein